MGQYYSALVKRGDPKKIKKWHEKQKHWFCGFESEEIQNRRYYERTILETRK